MTTPASSFSQPPQSGRMAPPAEREEEPRGLWSQLLTAFRDLSGAFDSFANDADPGVRALGRAARQRRQPHPDDFFALGDLCARLTPQQGTLSSTYAAKTVAAYTRAAEVASSEARTALHALLAFATWTADVARATGDDEALKVALLTCTRTISIADESGFTSEASRLRQTEAILREQLDRLQGEGDDGRSATLRQARLHTDQGQMLLRQGQPAEALQLFEQALAIDDRNHAAWLWRAMALTDLARFDDALASYDRALALEPESAGVWNNKGSLLMELGRLEPALVCFERALDLSAAVSTVKAVYWLNKGKALYMLGRHQEALDALVRSHQLDPSPESAAGIAACQDRLDLERSKT
jgi:tetratricopeptide (TPR) repeat protein